MDVELYPGAKLVYESLQPLTWDPLVDVVFDVGVWKTFSYSADAFNKVLLSGMTNSTPIVMYLTRFRFLLPCGFWAADWGCLPCFGVALGGARNRRDQKRKGPPRRCLASMTRQRPIHGREGWSRKIDVFL